MDAYQETLQTFLRRMSEAAITFDQTAELLDIEPYQLQAALDGEEPTLSMRLMPKVLAIYRQYILEA